MSQTKSLAAYHNNKATELSQEGQYPEALEHVEIAIRYNYSLSNLQNKGKICLKMGNFEESIRQFEIALSVGRACGAKLEELGDVELSLSDANVKRGDIPAARAHFKNYLELSGATKKIENTLMNQKQSDRIIEAELEYATGTWLMEAKSCQEAIECLKKAYAIYNSLQINIARACAIQLDVGNAYMSLCDVEQARKHFVSYVKEKGTDVHPLHALLEEESRKRMIKAEVENLIGCWYTRNCRYREAINHYQNATEFYESWLVPHYNIAKQHYLKADYRTCLKHCKLQTALARKYGASNEELASLSALAGDSYAKLGHLKKAILEYRNAVRRHSTEASRLMLNHLEFKSTAVNLHKMGNYKNAIFFYNKSLEIVPSDSELYFNIGRCYYKQKNLEEAASYYDKSLKCDPIKYMELNKRLMKRRWLSLFKRNRF